MCSHCLDGVERQSHGRPQAPLLLFYYLSTAVRLVVVICRFTNAILLVFCAFHLCYFVDIFVASIREACNENSSLRGRCHARLPNIAVPHGPIVRNYKRRFLNSGRLTDDDGERRRRRMSCPLFRADICRRFCLAREP